MEADGRVKGTNITSKGTWRKLLFTETEDGEEEGTKRSNKRKLHCKPRTASVTALQINRRRFELVYCKAFGNGAEASGCSASEAEWKVAGKRQKQSTLCELYLKKSPSLISGQRL